MAAGESGVSFICRRSPDKLSVIVSNRGLTTSPSGKVMAAFFHTLQQSISNDRRTLKDFRYEKSSIPMPGFYVLSAIVSTPSENQFWKAYVHIGEQIVLIQSLSSVATDSPTFVSLVRSFHEVSPQTLGQNPSHLDGTLTNNLAGIDIGPVRLEAPTIEIHIETPPILRQAGELEKQVENKAHELGAGAEHLWNEGTKAATTVLETKQRVYDQAVEAGMKALPADLRNGVQHLTSEAKKEIVKYPVVATVLLSELTVTNPALASEIRALLKEHCDSSGTVSSLASSAHVEVDRTGRDLGALTTLGKRLDVLGWINTGCTAQGEGIPVRTAQHSSDRFWTIDVQLTSFVIDSAAMPPENKFIRLEVEPGFKAHDLCDQHEIGPNDRVKFSGPVLIDTDFPKPFLEVHPLDDLQIIVNGNTSPRTTFTATASIPQVEGWLYLGRVQENQAWASGSPRNIKSLKSLPKVGDVLELTTIAPLRASSPKLQHANAAVVNWGKVGQLLKVINTELSHAKVGGNFVWVRVAPVQ